jgi:hypothetical protein
MARLVHIAPEPEAKKIKRNGISPRRRKGWIAGYDRFVWAFPVLESYTITHQWMRELKRLGGHTLVAVTIKIPDKERVAVCHYSSAPKVVTAAEAVRAIRNAEDKLGWEAVILRRVEPDEIQNIRVLPKGIGWRYSPDAKTKPLNTCDCEYCMPKGEVKAARYRARVAANMAKKGILSANYTGPDDDESLDDEDDGKVS